MSFSLRRVIIPEDILMEILVRLPAVSLMRFKCVSRIWSSLISSRYFTNIFFKYSSSRNPKRHVFVHWNHRHLFSSSLCNLDATSFLQLNPDLTLLGNKFENGKYYRYTPFYFVNVIRGLMCFRDERVVWIINFTTRQILILLQVESNILMESDILIKSDDGMVSRSTCTWNYLGYDPVNDEYKVLSTISKFSKVKESKSVRSETQVLVLGAEASWRNTKSLTNHPPHHYPGEEGISINGILYYGALSHKYVHVLMSLDFSSEEYNLIEFPNQVQAHISWENFCNYDLLVNLMNYQDQVAVFDGFRLASESILDLLVLEDAGKSKWAHKFFVLPCHELRRTLNVYRFKIRGTSRSGEITLCEASGNQNKIKHIIYDLERNHITRVGVIKPKYAQLGWSEMNIWEDVESIIYLES